MACEDGHVVWGARSRLDLDISRRELHKAAIIDGVAARGWGARLADRLPSRKFKLANLESQRLQRLYGVSGRGNVPTFFVGGAAKKLVK